MFERRQFPRFALFGVLACPVVAGCDDDQPAVFTRTEAMTVANAVVGVSTAPTVGKVMAGSDDSYEFEVDCSEGGKARISVTVKEDGTTHTITGVTEFIDCAEEIDDVVITLNGDVNSTTTLSFTVSDGRSDIDIDGTVAGEVDWEDDDGGEGTCELDLETDADFDITHKPWAVEQSGGMKGTVCGITVDDRNLDWRHWFREGLS